MNSAPDCEGFRARIRTRLFGRNLICLARIGSTNAVAKELARDGAPEGTVVVADEQTAGRGRLGRRWLAPPGTCLLCSVLFRPQLPLAQVHHLTMVCALAAADAIEVVGGLKAGLKWPNDLVIPCSTTEMPSPHWRKLAGLLTETGVAGERLDFAIVGLGINVNVPPEMLPSLAADATSVSAEIGRPVDRAELLGAMMAEVETRYERLRAGASPYDEWAARLLTLGQVVQATTPTGELTGVAESVDEAGALLLRTADGAIHTLTAGDVTLRPGDTAGVSRSQSGA